MKKRFNTTSPCVPNRHCMVDLGEQMPQIRELVEAMV